MGEGERGCTVGPPGSLTIGCARPNFLFDKSHAYLVYITKVTFWNHIERLCLAHLKVFALIFLYIPHLML